MNKAKINKYIDRRIKWIKTAEGDDELIEDFVNELKEFKAKLNSGDFDE